MVGVASGREMLLAHHKTTRSAVEECPWSRCGDSTGAGLLQMPTHLRWTAGPVSDEARTAAWVLDPSPCMQAVDATESTMLHAGSRTPSFRTRRVPLRVFVLTPNIRALKDAAYH